MPEDDQRSNMINAQESAAEEQNPSTPPKITHGKRILTSMQPELSVCNKILPNQFSRRSIYTDYTTVEDQNPKCTVLWLDAPIR